MKTITFFLLASILLCHSLQAQLIDTTHYFNKIYYTQQPDTLAITNHNVLVYEDCHILFGVRSIKNTNMELKTSIYMHKVDLSGNTIWIRNINIANDDDTFSMYRNSVLKEGKNIVLAYNVQETFYGPYTHIELMKVDTSGNVLWISPYDNFYATTYGLLSHNNNYLIFGHMGAYESEALLMQTDTSGNIQWHKGYAADTYQIPYSLLAIPDNKGYILSGLITKKNYEQFADSSDMLLIRTDLEGNLLWLKRFGNPDKGECALLTLPYDNNSYWGVSCGKDNSIPQNYISVARYKYENGDTIWRKKLAYIGGNNDYKLDGIYGIVSAHSGGIIMLGSAKKAGDAYTTPFILEYDSLANEIWFEPVIANPNATCYLMDIEPTIDGGYIMGGFQSQPPQYSWLRKVDKFYQTCSNLPCDSSYISFKALTDNISNTNNTVIIPNPADNVIYIQTTDHLDYIEFYNLLGQLMTATYLGEPISIIPVSSSNFIETNLFKLPLPYLNNGTYILKFYQKNNWICSKKLNIQH